MLLQFVIIYSGVYIWCTGPLASNLSSLAFQAILCKLWKLLYIKKNPWNSAVNTKTSLSGTQNMPQSKPLITDTDHIFLYTDTLCEHYLNGLTCVCVVLFIVFLPHD